MNEGTLTYHLIPQRLKYPYTEVQDGSSKALGHSSLKVTEKYARHNVEILRELIDDNAEKVAGLVKG